jgi:mannonate dehydratase
LLSPWAFEIITLDMSSYISRRRLAQTLGVSTLASLSSSTPAAVAASSSHNWPIQESADTPKLCLGVTHLEAADLRKVKQLGVDYILRGGPNKVPWQESELRSMMATAKASGLTLANLMIGGFPNAIYGRPGRDEEIDKVQQSIRASGRAGLPVVEYNFYAHRAMEGYYGEPGRAGTGYTAFDYARMKDLPPLPKEGAHSLDEMWANVTYFLKAVVPVAVESNVRLALHPNDPPAPISRGSGQIMATVAGWKKLVAIVPSPHNGITFDCGVTREMGENPVEVCRYFLKRDCINHVHFRNVRVRKPYENYAEVFIDEGQVDMFGVMRELVKGKYPRLIYPEHPRALDVDRDESPSTSSMFKSSYPNGGSYAGYAFNVGYARAMMQAAIES